MTVYLVTVNSIVKHVCESPSAARIRAANLRAKNRGPWVEDHGSATHPTWHSDSSGNYMEIEPREVEK